jgi:HEAT repeat protein
MTRRIFVHGSLPGAALLIAAVARCSAKLSSTFVDAEDHGGNEDKSGSKVAAKAAEASGVEDAWETLRELSESGNIQHRKYAAAGYALLASRSGRALKLITGTLESDNDLEMRTFAAAALGQEKCRIAIPALKKALNDRATSVSFAAAKALLDMHDHTGAVVFREVLLRERKDSTGMISGYLEDAKHKMHDPKQLAILGMNQAVGSFFGPAGMVLSLAEQNMKDKGAPGRALAAAALSTDRSTAARKALESALQDPSPLVRGAACRSLAVLGYPSSIPFIEPLLDDKGDAARAMAAAAYIRLKERRAS